MRCVYQTGGTSTWYRRSASGGNVSARFRFSRRRGVDATFSLLVEGEEERDGMISTRAGCCCCCCRRRRRRRRSPALEASWLSATIDCAGGRTAGPAATNGRSGRRDQMWNNWFRKAIGGRRAARPRRDHFSASFKRTKSTSPTVSRRRPVGRTERR